MVHPNWSMQPVPGIQSNVCEGWVRNDEEKRRVEILERQRHPTYEYVYMQCTAS